MQGLYDNPTVDDALQAIAFPVGAILWYAATAIPAHFLRCDGSTLLIENYPELYTAIGTTFGAATNGFKLPDLRSKFIRGWGGSYASTFGQTQEASRTNGIGVVKNTDGYGGGKYYPVWSNYDTSGSRTQALQSVSTASTSSVSAPSYSVHPYGIVLTPIIRY